MANKAATGPSPLTLKRINKIRKCLPAYSREEIADKVDLTVAQVDAATSQWKKWQSVIGDCVHYARPGRLTEDAGPKFILASAGQKFSADDAYAAKSGSRARLRTVSTTMAQLDTLCAVGLRQATSEIERANWKALGGAIHGAAVHASALVDIEKAVAKKK